jgi:hypothetical protein
MPTDIISEYIAQPTAFPLRSQVPWDIVSHLDESIRALLPEPGSRA